ncbi:hypothetical protein HPB49_018008 [Dermacentor silvarum]|uniref:Uncharacterized protein n=1 Tax=Dermacentor silvarum TaxID=543639 RepID=A0ACB8DEU2_DERSI|nr:hypothetical protein HPB49_018008 [Dermacentor silvarum]
MRIPTTTELISELRKFRRRSLEPPHPDVAVASKTPGYWVTCVFLGILFLALVTAGFIGYLATSGHGTKATPSEDRFCSISGCLDHANIIGLSDINDGLHKSSPCEDFGHFICSAWTARHERENVKRRITQNVLTDAAVDYIVSLEKWIDQQHAFAISKRPERMMDVCLMNRPSDDTIVLDQLLDFMNHSGFGFPAENVTESDYSQSLKALTELAYNWALPLWFYVDLVLTDTAPGRTISLRTAAFGDMYDIIHEALMEYEDVYSWYIDTIVEIVYRGSIGLSFHEFTRGSKILQKDVFKNLSWVIRSNNRAPILLQVKSLPYFVGKTTVEHWLEAFGPLWSVDTAISQEDVVYFPDRDLLVVMNALFKGYTARDIYLHVHWWFVQILGVVASNHLFESLRKDPERGEFTQKLMCSVHVTLNYNAIFSIEKRAQFDPSARIDIMTRLENVRAVALNKISSTLGARFGLLLEQVKPIVWLPDPYASEDWLLRLYGPETNNNATTDEDNFVERWLSRATSYQQSSTFLAERSTDASLFRTDSSVLSSHHVLSKTISLSLALLEAPFYYPNATSAIFYGGLGFVYATELVRLINSLSVLLEGRDSIVPSKTAFSQSYAWLPYSCREKDIREIPRIVALELAYAAYRDFRMDTEDVRLSNAKAYSPEQVFFATVCYLMCDRDWGAGTCTATLSAFPQFTTAFSCPTSHARPCNILD